MQTTRLFTRILGYALCLSMAGCCGMCKKLESCNDYLILEIYVQRLDKKRIVDTLTVIATNDSSRISKRLQVLPPVYVTKTPLPDEKVSSISTILGFAAFNNYPLTANQILALKNYRFELYMGNNRIAAIDSIKTGIGVGDEGCGKLMCAQILSFRENGRTYTHKDSFGRLVEY